MKIPTNQLVVNLLEIFRFLVSMVQPETSLRIARMVFVSPSCENITPEEEEILEELEEGVAGFRFLLASSSIIPNLPGARGSHLPLPHVGSHLPLLKVEVGANVTLG